MFLLEVGPKCGRADVLVAARGQEELGRLAQPHRLAALGVERGAELARDTAWLTQ